ncbi:uncharacterized protein LOC142079963 isoform X4 [Calonectris borealis]|uniref:uncharacterized protein LOC142079963 isoform X4 n=1 Tax=Calonectris borealis TaxID=1323832 RepID=UPI003F4C5BB6
MRVPWTAAYSGSLKEVAVRADDLLLHNRQAAEQSLRLCCPKPGERGTGVPCLPLTQEEDCPGCDSDRGPGLPDGTGSLGSSTCRRRKRRKKMITSVKPYPAGWRSWGEEPTAQQSQHLLCPEQALLLHSYYATAWGNPQTAGRGWEGLETSPQLAPGLLAPRLPWAKTNLCSNGPASQDSPCACTRARQGLPLPPALPTRHGVCWHRHAVHRLQHLLLVLLSTCMNHLKLPLLPAPSSGWWTGAPRSAHSQYMQSHPMSSGPAGCSQCAWERTVSDLPCLFLLPCSSLRQLGTS